MQKAITALLCIVAFLVSCASPTLQPTVTVVAQPTFTAIATQTPVPTQTALPTPTETATPEIEVTEIANMDNFNLETLKAGESFYVLDLYGVGPSSITLEAEEMMPTGQNYELKKFKSIGEVELNGRSLWNLTVVGKKLLKVFPSESGIPSGYWAWFEFETLINAKPVRFSMFDKGNVFMNNDPRESYNKYSLGDEIESISIWYPKEVLSREELQAKLHTETLSEEEVERARFALIGAELAEMTWGQVIEIIRSGGDFNPDEAVINAFW